MAYRIRQRAMLPRTGFVLLMFGLAYFTFSPPDGASELHQYRVSRQLLSEEDVVTDESEAAESKIAQTNSSSNSTNTTLDDGALFPPDLFTETQLKHGAVVLHILGIIYMFYALALVCDEFFVPSLDVITEKLGISPDVAGATFMAAGGSAPELFTSIIGVFIAKSDVGIGTIVGSAVFNILFVIAACAFAAKEALSLTAWPLIRDVFFYSVALIVLVVFFLDNVIYWWEALILFLWYFAYVGFMKFNEPAEDALRKLFRLPAQNREGLERGVTLRNAVYRRGLYHLMNETINPGILSIVIGQQQAATGITGLKQTLDPRPPSLGGPTNGVDKELDDMNNGSNSAAAAPQHNNPATGVAANVEGGSGDIKIGGPPSAEAEDGDKKEEEEPINMKFPRHESWLKILLYLISFPIMAPLYVTLPDTKNKSKRDFFIITFVGSILWIAIYSYLMVWWATVAGQTIGIPPPVMGLTFLAAGTSVPDLITSVLVAKQGKGDMAVSSSVGSNIFDVTVGLPLPWLLYTTIEGHGISVKSDGVGCSVSLLFLMLILVFLSIVIFKWKMTKGMGVIMLGLYVVFVVVTLGFTYNWYKCPFDA